MTYQRSAVIGLLASTLGCTPLLADWASHPIDFGAADKPSASLAQDGLLQVSYLDKTSGNFKLAVKAPATQWKISVLQAMPDSMVAQNYSHQLDLQGNLHLVYRDEGGAVLYAHDINNNKWSFVALATLKDSAIPLNMFRNYGDEIQYYSNASGNWHLEVLSKPALFDAIKVSLSPPAAAIDAEGHEHVVYSRGSSFQGSKGNVSLGVQLLYATNKTGAWEIDKAVGEGTTANERQIYAPVMAIDITGYAHVVYAAAVAERYTLRYATNASGRWKASNIVSFDGILYPKHLAINPIGNQIHLVYHQQEDANSLSVQYATNQRLNQWTQQTIYTPSLQTSQVTSKLQSTFAVDKANVPHYIFVDTDSASLEALTP